MPDHKARFESMLFNHETCNRMDYRDGEIKPIITTQYKGKRTCLRVKPPPLKDIAALTDWHVPNVPFDLFGKPKDILRTNPNEIQKPYGRIPDSEQKVVQKTRPRVYITPAESLDDMDERSRKLLVDNMYITSQVSTMRDALSKANYKNVRAPFPGKPAPANPIALPKLQPPYVSPEWRMDSVSFDNRQLRAYCDPTIEYWLAKKPNCTECTQTAARDAIKKMKRRH